MPKAIEPEWFARPDGPEGGAGLRFGCTMCGNCCSGPPGFVLVDDDEINALAQRLNLTRADFLRQYTHMETEGRSLNEVRNQHGNDCVFLDRQKIPGKAVCGVYQDRPKQCRSWPFWPSLLKNREAWTQAKRKCPGLDNGKLVTVDQIRIQRAAIKI
jgi:Fe-S-cluster containining protein